MSTNHHASDDQIIGYLYRTLSDAEREVIDGHFSDCPNCRARLTLHEGQQRQIDRDMKAAIRQVSPSDQMTFASIAPHLPKQRQFSLSWLQMDTATPIFITLGGIILALIGLVRGLEALVAGAGPHPPGALPTLAGFAFVFVSVGQIRKSLAIRSRFLIMAILTALLWLGTAILGLLNLLVILDLSLWFFLVLGGSNDQAWAATILVMLISTMIYIIAVIGGADYHYKNLGQPSSWKLISLTIGITLLIMVLPYFVF